MFFDDDYKLKKVDLGTKKIVKKEDFLKKIEESKKITEEKPKKDYYYGVIAKFVRKLKFCKIDEIKSKTKNLEMIISTNNRPEFKDKQEKISITAFDKIKYDLDKIIFSIRNSKMIDLIKNINAVLKFIRPAQLIPLINNNIVFFKNLFVVCTLTLYIYLKKQYLIDENFIFFDLYNLFFCYVNDQEINKKICRKLGRNKSYLFSLVYILKNYNKFITDQSRIKFLNFAFTINDLYLVRTKDKIVNEFFEFCVASYLEILDTTKNFDEVMRIFKDTDIFFYLTKSNSNEFLNFLTDTKALMILSKIAYNINSYQFKSKVKLNDDNIVIFKKLFNTIRKQNLNLNSPHFEKLRLNRQNVMKMVNDILDYLFGNYSNSNLRELILLIWYSGKLLENLYSSSIEKNEFYNILDYLVNKIVNKYYFKILDDILIFSVDIINDFLSQTGVLIKLNSDSKKVLEMVSFVVISKVEYKANYYFSEFNMKTDIYKNLPFNYKYLRVLTKSLIKMYTYILSRKQLDKIEKLKENIIIKYSEIEFSPNDKFWINLELISKISSFKPSTQLEAIKIMPFIYPFPYRLQILNTFNKEYKLKQLNLLQDSLMEMDNPQITTDFRISRNNIYEHSFQYYVEGKFNPFIRWKITFINEFGIPEEGVDAGGLFKEYIFKLSEKAFAPENKMFIETSSGFLMPNPDSYKMSTMHLTIFQFLGFIAGKAILDDINIWPNLSNFFLNNILEIENSFNELKNYDPDLFKNLVYLKDYDGDCEKDLALDFTLSENKEGKMVLVELIENGNKINVNNSNKLLYIKKVAQYKLYSQIKSQCEHFKKGLLSVFDGDGLKIFTSNELRQIINGLDKPIDVNDLKSYTVYNGWNNNNPNDAENINNFWSILEDFDAKEREKLLFFVTSLKRPPLVGFKALHPKFVIAKSDKEVPTASTCTNMLLLPVLPKEKLRNILKYVINADAGFYYG